MITRAAVKILDKRQNKEIIIPCHRHCDAFQILYDFGYKRNVDFQEIEQGFLDSDYNFVNRIVAWYEAKKCNQLISDSNRPTELYSEDLW